jgi:hypothetical protein
MVDLALSHRPHPSLRGRVRRIHRARGRPGPPQGAATSAGVDIVMALTDQDYGSREFAARDPECNV